MHTFFNLFYHNRDPLSVCLMIRRVALDGRRTEKEKLKNIKATGFNQNIPAINISQSVGVLFGGKINDNYKYYDTRCDFSLQR